MTWTILNPEKQEAAIARYNEYLIERWLESLDKTDKLKEKGNE